MRSTYRVLSYAIAVEVAIQAATIAFGSFGLDTFIDEGGTVNEAVMDDAKFTGALGFVIHGINGQMVIPLLAVALLVVSFFARIPSGQQYAGAVVVLVAAQVTLGLTAHSAPALAPFHGIVALILFGVSADAARRAGPTATQRAEVPGLSA